MGETGSGDDFDLLVGNIKQELQAQNALRNLRLSDGLLDELAATIGANIHYAFEYRLMDQWRHPPDSN